MIGTQDVGTTVAIEVGRDDVVRAGGSKHAALPMESAAGVEVHDDLLWTSSLVHVCGDEIEFPVAVEVGHVEGVDYGFNRFRKHVLFPVAGFGVGRRSYHAMRCEPPLSSAGARMMSGRPSPLRSPTATLVCG